MNISEIQAHPAYKRLLFADYNVAMRSLIQEKWLKNWIDNLQTDTELRPKLLKEPAQVRVRHNEAGEIYEMMAHSPGAGHMCCMFYREQEDFATLKKIIEEH